ncbi:tRNA(Met) cytidine acetate ligase [Blautia sp. MSJ-19]|uniref:tRNA(Met) cytidine acetate ligase n=1 Tax=Blautia sp. MSJ-19 TaxID=2841517 RepID=UPI001C0F1883|nr:nucleotidyltransferase family protein [Blautia sp. MSJ-19]MBU5481758.1 nucleotidyltransferase family protein [Blautia sp. MSJ-19]
MKVTGIIAEYNPFHRGHKYQIDYCKKELHSDYVIVAMSGDYVQRGTPALLPKHARAEMALRCGADLVLEMPASVSTASAEAFAMGGVSTLNELHVVDELCFGSEYGDVSALQELAEILVKEPEEYRRLLKGFLSSGRSFPVARSQALMEYFKNPRNFTGDDFDGDLTPLLNQITQILGSPNNILGIEYCKALLRLESNIKPVTLKRRGMGYHETLPAAAASADPVPFASASAIRELLNSASVLTSEMISRIARQVPDEASSLLASSLQKNEYLAENALDPLLSYCILKGNADSFCNYLDVSRDLAERIVNRSNEINGFLQAASLLKTRELTQTRIQRALLHIILDIREVPSAVPYARVLGFRRESSSLLKEIKRSSSISLLTKLADTDSLVDETSQKLLAETTFASNLYEKLLCQKSDKKFIHEYQKQLIIL